MLIDILVPIFVAAVAIAVAVISARETLKKEPIVIVNIKSPKKKEDAVKTNNEIREKKRMAVFAIVAVILTQSGQVLKIRNDFNENAEKAKLQVQKEKVQKDAEVFLKSGLYEIDEASGGAMIGDIAYIVDDDTPSIFPMKYGGNSGYPNEFAFEFPEHGIPICGTQNIGRLSKPDFNKKKLCPDGSSKLVDGDSLDDLEGVASYDKKLYLITSHSNSRRGIDQPKRQVFLEVELQTSNTGKTVANITNYTGELRDKIKKHFLNNSQGLVFDDFQQVGKYDQAKIATTEVMNIEGLAIDSEGKVYLGFRNPLINGHALILRTDLSQVFTSDPKFEHFLFQFGTYGIVSLDFKDGKIYILGNSNDRYISEDFKIWEWEPSDSKIQDRLHLYHGNDLFAKFSEEGIGSRPAKPEVLLVPNEETFHLFFDADGTGGQLPLFRKDRNLSRAPKL